MSKRQPANSLADSSRRKLSVLRFDANLSETLKTHRLMSYHSDASCSVASANAYLSNELLATCDTLRSRALLSQKTSCTSIEAMLTAMGRERRSWKGRHLYDVPSQPAEIGNRTTKVRSFRTNDLVERMIRALLNKRFRASGRYRACTTSDHNQGSLETFPHRNSDRRGHLGFQLLECSPAHAHNKTIGKEDEPATLDS